MSAVRASLASGLPAVLVDELLDAHMEAKRNFFLGGLRLSGVEGGRFCEAMFRILEHLTTAAFTPLGQQLDTDGLIRRLQQMSHGSAPDAVRLHLPRALRVVYDVRNKRDVAHLADGIDPNVQDASLVIAVLDWCLAELVRLQHSVPADAAQRVVDSLVTRTAPVIQDFDGFPKVLKTGLSAGDHCLVLLYDRGAIGASFTQLREWVPQAMRRNLARTLARLVDDLCFVHHDGAGYRITLSGERQVEARRLAEHGS